MLRDHSKEPGLRRFEPLAAEAVFDEEVKEASYPDLRTRLLQDHRVLEIPAAR